MPLYGVQRVDVVEACLLMNNTGIHAHSAVIYTRFSSQITNPHFLEQNLKPSLLGCIETWQARGVNLRVILRITKKKSSHAHMIRLQGWWTALETVVYRTWTIRSCVLKGVSINLNVSYYALPGDRC